MTYLSIGQIREMENVQDLRRTVLERSILAGRKTVFLSHSHKDADIVVLVIRFLLTVGMHVYVDWLDPAMPGTTSADTAAKVRSKIVECDRFVVLLSENSTESKWVPWELGYADGKKPNRDIAIFPVKRSDYTSDDAFRGLEYLYLYQTISIGIGKVDGARLSAVFPPEGGDGRWLSNWLG